MTKLSPTNLYAVPVPENATDFKVEQPSHDKVFSWNEVFPSGAQTREWKLLEGNFRYLGLVTAKDMSLKVILWFTSKWSVSNSEAYIMVQNTMKANECFFENPYEKASDLFTAEEANGFPLEYFRQQELRTSAYKKVSPAWAIIERL